MVREKTPKPARHVHFCTLIRGIGHNKGTFAGSKRPEFHSFNNFTGRFFPGVDARIDDIKIPKSCEHDNATLTCRKCKKFSVKYKDHYNWKLKSRSIGKIRDHEENCLA